MNFLDNLTKLLKRENLSRAEIGLNLVLHFWLYV